jgi:putative toxin-antitoxin system antitoxin component (TIGR02293 family)
MTNSTSKKKLSGTQGAKIASVAGALLENDKRVSKSSRHGAAILVRADGGRFVNVASRGAGAMRAVARAEGYFVAFRDSVVHVGATERINRIRHGIEAKNIVHVSEHFNVSRDTIGNIIGITPATMNRKIKSQSILTPSESEKLERIAEIEAEAEDVFGDGDKARNWMLKENTALGSAPLSLLDTELGTGEVRKVLNAIAYGGAV